MRRFAATLTADRADADAVVLEVLKQKRDHLRSGRDLGRVRHAMLQQVYRRLFENSDRRRKLLLINPSDDEEISAPIKLQSLDILKRAVVSLHVLEDMSAHDIAAIFDQSAQDIKDIIKDSLEFLSNDHSPFHESQAGTSGAAKLPHAKSS